MSLKLATLEDRDAVLRMCRSFFEVTPFAPVCTYSDAKVEALLGLAARSFYQECLFLLFLENDIPHGLIVGYATQTPFSDDLVAAELAWWVDPEYRGTKGSMELVLAYEAWAKKIGCKHVTMSLLPSLTNPKVEGYYERLGYVKTEISYLKEL